MHNYKYKPLDIIHNNFAHEEYKDKIDELLKVYTYNKYNIVYYKKVVIYNKYYFHAFNEKHESES
jgi:hypothetical protein